MLWVLRVPLDNLDQGELMVQVVLRVVRASQVRKVLGVEQVQTDRQDPQALREPRAPRDHRARLECWDRWAVQVNLGQ